MTIYTAPVDDPARVTLVARRSDWQAVLEALPQGSAVRGEDKVRARGIRAAITRALAGEGDVLRVTLDPDDAAQVLAG